MQIFQFKFFSLFCTELAHDEKKIIKNTLSTYVCKPLIVIVVLKHYSKCSCLWPLHHLGHFEIAKLFLYYNIHVNHLMIDQMAISLQLTNSSSHLVLLI